MRMNKRGQALDMLTKLMVGVASIAIILVITFLVISQGLTQIAATDGITNTSDTVSRTVGYNATLTVAEAVDDIPDWIPLVIVATIGAALLGITALFKRR